MVRQRTMLINTLRGLPCGVGRGIGASGVTAKLKALHERQEALPIHARSALHGITAQLRMLDSELDRLEAQILAWHRADEPATRYDHQGQQPCGAARTDPMIGGASRLGCTISSSGSPLHAGVVYRRNCLLR